MKPILALLALVFTASLSFGERPNIIFILTDDQRQDSLPCYGNDFVKTPNLDKLAAEGVVFDNASVTSAICTPSRVCYFLGQYERRHSINFNSGTTMAAEAWAKSYPVVLRENGYYTGYVGKNHVPIGKKGYKTGLMDRSFDYWYAGHGHLRFYPKEIHKIFKANSADTQVEVVTNGALSFLKNNGSYLEGALHFLEARPDKKPFCLSICLNVPHGAGVRNMQMRPTDPELYRTTYRDQIDQITLPKTYLANKEIKEPKLPADVLYAEFRQTNYDNVNTPAELRELMVREYQTITGIDRMLGHLREELSKQGLADNTVIVLSSDHGLLHGEFGLGGKSLNYEACLAVPLIVHDPRLPADRKGSRVEELVQSIDLGPTLLDLASVTPPATMQGRSYLPLVKGESVPDWKKYAFAENLWSTVFGNPRIESVRSKKWKYLRYFKNDRAHWADRPKTGPKLYKVTAEQRDLYSTWLTASIEGEAPIYEELYDLANDPHETTNLANEQASEKILAEMRAQCAKLVRIAKGPLDANPAVTPIDLNSKPR